MKRTRKPTTAGILNIISGAFFLIGGIVIVSLLVQPATATSWASYAMYSMGLSGAPSTSFVTTFIVILGTAVIVPGIVSLLGGIYAIERSIWGLALAGSISTLLSSTPLGIPAIIFTALSKKEFA